MSNASAVVDYLNSLSPEEKKVLGKLRNQILALVPAFEERLSRGVPFFYYKGKRAVGFRSSKAHLSFFIMEGKVMTELRKEIAHLDYSNTVIRFKADQPIPGDIIEKLVLARVKEIENTVKKK
ncbi:MAG: iron chaperone [Chitinophagaceae bacterium]